MSEPRAVSRSTPSAGAPATTSQATKNKIFARLNKIIPRRRLEDKDPEKVMENIGSHEDWKRCFAEIAPGLLLFARQWANSAADAEDIVQETFVKFWRRNHKIDNRALLYSAVRSTALDFIRRDSRRARREASAFGENDDFTEPKFEIEDETQRALADAISGLPQEQREVLVMKVWNDLTFAEIAIALRISQNTAASRYRYALTALKKVLQPQ
jgi:RNA polymerase sigma-70 factor (ECF subfamily)